jgi:hypothetical protein
MHPFIYAKFMCKNRYFLALLTKPWHGLLPLN